MQQVGVKCGTAIEGLHNLEERLRLECNGDMDIAFTAPHAKRECFVAVSCEAGLIGC